MAEEGPEPEDFGWTVFRLPRSHWHCQLSNFEWEHVQPLSTKKRVYDFVQECREGKSPHLILTGQPGHGKSHIGVGIYRALSVVFGTGLVTWINVPSFCENVKRSYGLGEDPWTDVEEARRLVVLDDLFGRELTAHEKDQIITRLLDTAYMNNAAVVCTMHDDVRSLQARLQGHEISRLLANSTIIPLVGQKDYRR